MDCQSRNMLRQLLDKGIADTVSATRSLIILEANTGSAHLYKLLQMAGGREKVTPELAQRSLKDIVYNKWVEESPCGVCCALFLLQVTPRRSVTRPRGMALAMSRIPWTRRRC